jgi:alkylresorcinol/alkylpyrone synthase
MFIAGLGTAAPQQRYKQREGWELVQQTKVYDRLDSRARAIVKKVLTGDNGIAARHLALDNLAEAFELTPDALHARFVKNAPRLAAEAAERALADAGCQPADMDAVIISTCTGYLCPGLTSYVSERMGLRPDVLALDLVGLGCGAAVPNLRTGEGLLSTGRYRRVLSVCVEVCSAAFFLDNDPGVLISACLFGDGAGAAVLAAEPRGNRRVEWKLAGSVLEPRHRDLLRFEQKDGMLRNILTPAVPELAAEMAERVLTGVLARTPVGRTEITGWALHPGGREVLVALRRRLGVSDKAVRWSAAVLEEYGNLSSSSVFFVLEAMLADSTPNGWWWLSTFGAGFSGHGALLEVER